MRAVKVFLPWPLVVLLAATAVAPRGEPPAPLLAPLAHSAALTLEGASVPGALILRVRPSATGNPLSVSDFAASIDGQEMPATPQADGAWRVPLPSHPAASEGRLDVAVTHDGIRELLTARVALARPDCLGARRLGRSQSAALVGAQHRHRADRGRGDLAPHLLKRALRARRASGRATARSPP